MKSPDHHIHHGTSTNPNPHEQDATPEQIAERQERIETLVNHLLYGECKPSDLLQEDCYDLIDMVIVQAFREKALDSMERMGNIDEAITEACTRSATWLIDQGNTTVSLAIKKKLGVE